MNTQLEIDKSEARAEFPHLHKEQSDRPDFRKLGDYNTDNCCWVRQTGSGSIVSCHPSTPGSFQMYYGETDWVHVGEANTDDAVKAKLVEMGWLAPNTTFCVGVIPLEDDRVHISVTSNPEGSDVLTLQASAWIETDDSGVGLTYFTTGAQA